MGTRELMQPFTCRDLIVNTGKFQRISFSFNTAMDSIDFGHLL